MTSDLTILSVAILIALVIFFLPTVIAFAKNRKYRWVVLFVNVVAGFTLIGWFGALIWSIAEDTFIKNER
jgi:hypothetical protein